jgi:hypothetical protein
MHLRHLCAGLALGAALLLTGCSHCGHRGCSTPVVGSAPVGGCATCPPGAPGAPGTIGVVPPPPAPAPVGAIPSGSFGGR